MRHFKAFNLKRERDNKNIATWIYAAADVIGLSVNRFINGKQMPSLNACFPGIFDEADEEEAKVQRSTANFLNFAESFNRKFTGKD